MVKKRLSVILVAYKNKQYIDGCIGSLLRQELPEERIIVVDNASPYGEADYIEKKWRNINVIRMGANSGFSKANNEGMKLAISLGADYCLLLNLDTVVCDGMLEELINSIPSGDNGISTPRIYTTRSKRFNWFNSKESIPWYTGGAIDRETFITNQKLYDYEDTTIRSVAFASGCCMLIPREVIQKAGFLEEDYFLYYEDVEYCLRLQKMGIEIWYNPNALLWHAEGGSQRQEKKVADYYWTRNRLFCIQKYMNVLQADPFELIRATIRNEDYFTGYNSKRIISYEKKAFEDFISGTIGQIASYAYYFDDSFEKEVRENGRGAAWSTNVCGSVLLCNFSDSEKFLSLEFGIDTEELKDTSTYTLYLDGELYRKKCHSNMGYEFVIPFNRLEQHKLTVVKDRNRYVIRESDEVPLFFRLNSFQLQEYSFVLETGAIKIENIGVTECDQQLRWNWIQAESANIVLANPFRVEKKYKLSFSTYSPSDQKRITFSINGEDFEEEIGKEFIYELAVEAQKQIDIRFYGIGIKKDAKNLSLIDFKWELVESFSTSIGSTSIHTSPYVCGFGEEEKQDNRYWNWIVKPQAKVVIHNVDHIAKVIKVSFCTFSACDQKNYSLCVNERQQECTVGEEMTIDYGLPAEGEMVLLFNNMGSPTVLNNKERLYLSVIDFKVEELKAVQYQIEDCGKIMLINWLYKPQRYRICFDTTDIKRRLDFKILSREEEFSIEPGHSFAYEVMLEKNESVEAAFVVEDCLDKENLLERINFLVAEIDTFTASADCHLIGMSNYIQGFSTQEREDDRYWNWIVKPQAKVIIHNTDHYEKVIRISFNTFSACDHKNYTMRVNGRQQECIVGERLVLDYTLSADGEIVLLFYNLGSPQVLTDGTELYLSVINFMIEEAKAAQYEIEDCEKIVLRNQLDENQRYRISFSTADLNKTLGFQLPDRGEEFSIEPVDSFVYEVMLEKNESMEAIFAIEDYSDKENLLEQINFLVAEIDIFEASAECRLAEMSNYIQGFGIQEWESGRYWNWIVKPQAKVIIHNTDHFAKAIRISFNTFSACDHKNYMLYVNGRQQECIIGAEIVLDYALVADGESVLLFDNMGSPQPLNNGIELYLSVINFKIEEMRAAQYQIGDYGNIELRNQFDELQRYRISFNTADLNKPLEFKLSDGGEVFAIEPGLSFIYEVMLEKNESMEAVFSVEDCLDKENLLERINFLIAEIDTFGVSADCQLAEMSNYIQGFSSQERDDNSYWNWIVKSDARIIFHNTVNMEKNVQISFNTFSACDNKEYILSIDGNEQREIVGEEFNECYKLSAGGELCLCFKDMGSPLELEDGRSLYLSIINFNAQISEG